MTTVDWSRPIEAVHEDGRVVAVAAVPNTSGSYYINPELAGGWFHFRASGHHFFSTCPWRIRNTPATEQFAENAKNPLPPELQQRMVALLRQQVAALAKEPDEHVTDAVREARAIVADPGFPAEVDGDLVEARECVANVYDGAGRPELAAQARSGKMDGRLRVQSALAALRRGKQMAEEA